MTILNTPERQGGCACGHADETLPELDARLIPHQLRHAAVFGAFESLHPGSAMALVAPHDPQPLVRQLEDRYGDTIEVAYLVSGPERWTLKLARV